MLGDSCNFFFNRVDITAKTGKNINGFITKDDKWLFYWSSYTLNQYSIENKSIVKSFDQDQLYQTHYNYNAAFQGIKYYPESNSIIITNKDHNISFINPSESRVTTKSVFKDRRNMKWKLCKLFGYSDANQPSNIYFDVAHVGIGKKDSKIKRNLCINANNNICIEYIGNIEKTEDLRISKYYHAPFLQPGPENVYDRKQKDLYESTNGRYLYFKPVRQSQDKSFTI